MRQYGRQIDDIEGMVKKMTNTMSISAIVRN